MTREDIERIKDEYTRQQAARRDCISRQAAIAEFACCELTPDGGIDVNYAIEFLMNMPSVQPEVRTPMSSADCISRQDFDKFLEDAEKEAVKNRKHVFASALNTIRGNLKIFPSAQPERTCVNCGRTANNGGWYADGGTRCPIEEHYALPKDGYCHLWEKRNVTDDDYPERRTDE